MAVLAFVGGSNRASGPALEGVPRQRAERNGAVPAGGGGAARVVEVGGDLSAIRGCVRPDAGPGRRWPSGLAVVPGSAVAIHDRLRTGFGKVRITSLGDRCVAVWNMRGFSSMDGGWMPIPINVLADVWNVL